MEALDHVITGSDVDQRVDGSASAVEAAQEGEYYPFFGLSASPFTDVISPDFFYRTEQHEDALARMMMCITQHRALGLVWGRTGTGKTLLTQMLLTNVDTSRYIPIVVLCTPGMTKTALLREILSELKLGDGLERTFTQGLLSTLHQFLIEKHRLGQRVVMLVDEAHFLSADSLHMVRTLSNLETTEEKLITCILFAEERFLRRLHHPSYNSLRGRISLYTELKPLDLKDTEQYMKFRLLMAGGNEGIFESATYPLIHEKSGGICREISKLADNALLEAYFRRRRTVTVDIVMECIGKSL